MSDRMNKLLAAASQASAATTDMIEDVRDGKISPMGNIGSGDTLTIMADSLRLVIEARQDSVFREDSDADIDQLHGALVRFLEDRT